MKGTEMNDAEKVFAMVFALILFFVLNLAVFAVMGVVIAYFWNNFLIPNVDLTLSAISWWQAAIGVWLVRILKNVLFGK